MTQSITFSAVLLAGGRSTRMGVDKALLKVDGRALWKRQWALLEAAGVKERFISVRQDQAWVPDDALVVHDPVSDAGPLAGIAAALGRMQGSHLLVLAIDLPRMELAWLQRMMAGCLPGVGAVGCREGFCEPLAAIYPRELRGAADAALARGEYALKHLIVAAASAMRVIEVDAAEEGWFTNWNEPGDMAHD